MGFYRGIIAIPQNEITPEMKELSVSTEKLEGIWPVSYSKRKKMREAYDLLQSKVYKQLRPRMNPFYYEMYTDEGEIENTAETAMFSIMFFDSSPECAIGLDGKKHRVIQVSQVDWKKTNDYLKSLIDAYVSEHKKNFNEEPKVSYCFADYFLSLNNEMTYVEEKPLIDFEAFIKEQLQTEDYLLFVEFKD